VKKTKEPQDEMRMSANEFDRIMRGAFQVSPSEPVKAKQQTKKAKKKTKSSGE
jgi:hypothetical protein